MNHSASNHTASNHTAPVRTGYLLEDFRIFYNADHRMKTVPLHYHDFHKIVILLSGNVSYMIEGRSYDLQPGDLVPVRAGAMHRPIVHDDTLYERIIVYISPFFSDGLSKEADDDFNPVRDLFEPASGNPGVIRPGKSMSGMFSTLFTQLKSLAAEAATRNRPALQKKISPNRSGSDSPAATNRPRSDSAVLTKRTRPDNVKAAATPQVPYASALYGRIKVTELMILLMRALRGDDLLHVGTASSDSMAEQIMTFIRDRLSDPDLNVDAIAAHVSLNRSYLMHYFKEQTGYTIGQFITEKRLFLARSLILRGLPATSVCYDCGFGSYTSFYRAYVKKYCASPAGRTYEDRPGNPRPASISLSSVPSE